MASKMTLDADALISAAEKVDASASELDNLMRRFQTVIETLNSTWSSDVKDKFFRSYEKDLKALQEMADQYSEVSRGLRTVAEHKRRAEEAVKSKLDGIRKACG